MEPKPLLLGLQTVRLTTCVDPLHTRDLPHRRLFCHTLSNPNLQTVWRFVGFCHRTGLWPAEMAGTLWSLLPLGGDEMVNKAQRHSVLA